MNCGWGPLRKHKAGLWGAVGQKGGQGGSPGREDKASTARAPGWGMGVRHVVKNE